MLDTVAYSTMNKKLTTFIMILFIILMFGLYGIYFSSPATETSTANPKAVEQTEKFTCKNSENNLHEEHGYLIPDDITLESLNETALTLIYWRYINTIQFLCRNQTRVGRMKDGGKELCIDEKYRPKKPCLVYSFGSNYEFSFEISMRDRFGCEIHTFDPSITLPVERVQIFTHFHKIGLSNKDYRDTDKNWQMKRLTTIITDLQHEYRTIDMLKIDIEWGEWNALPDIFLSGELQRVRQICLEVHFGSNRPVGENETISDNYVTSATQLKILSQLYKEGFRIFMREYNTYAVQRFPRPYREITRVCEISLVNLNLVDGTDDFDHRIIFGNKASKFDVFT